MIPPIPQVLCSSPLRRCLHTLCLTWRGLLPQRPPQTIHVRENLREVIGKNTCDQRSTKSEILASVQQDVFTILFEDTFTEHDHLWTVRILGAHISRRAKRTMRCALGFTLRSRPCGRTRHATQQVRIGATHPSL